MLHYWNRTDAELAGRRDASSLFSLRLNFTRQSSIGRSQCEKSLPKNQEFVNSVNTEVKRRKLAKIVNIYLINLLSQNSRRSYFQSSVRLLYKWNKCNATRFWNSLLPSISWIDVKSIKSTSLSVFALLAFLWALLATDLFSKTSDSAHKYVRAVALVSENMRKMHLNFPHNHKPSFSEAISVQVNLDCLTTVRPFALLSNRGMREALRRKTPEV